MNGGGTPTRYALVAFTGRTELWWLRLLKPGFRHCFALIEDASGWIVCDALAHRLSLSVLPPRPAAVMFGQLLEAGYVVVPVRPRSAPRRAAMAVPFTCVEAVKRLLGLRARRILTPWQLFRHLTVAERTAKKVLDNGPM